MNKNIDPSDLAMGMRLKLARVHAGFETAKDAASAFGWTYPTYKKHETGERGLKTDKADTYGAAFHVSAEWLLLGTNPPKWLDDGMPPARAHMDFRMLPRLSMSDAIVMPNGFEHVREMTRLQTAVDRGSDIGPRAFSVAVEDDSMVSIPASGTDSFKPNDILAIDPDQRIAPGDFVLAEVGTEVVFRKYRPRGIQHGKPIFELAPLNNDYATILSTSIEPCRIIGRLCRHIRAY